MSKRTLAHAVRKRIGWCAAVLLSLLTLSGCSNTAAPPATPTIALIAPAVTVEPLQPTYTPAGVTVAPQPTLANPTAVALPPTVPPVDFAQPVITFQYAIPAIGLDRRLEGTIASHITLTDVATGKSERLRNQGGVLLELQEALKGLTLAPLPDGCDTCVHFSFDLPVEGISGDGWLQDSIMLASVENFMAVWLGPHFPPETAVGLRRAASGYNVAHTVAILPDGRIWRWQATDSQIAPAEPGGRDLVQAASALPLDRLEDSYSAACANFPRETLYIRTAEAERQIKITCPALSLPRPITALYAAISDLAAASLDPTVNLPFPDPLLPLDALLYYRRQDGAALTLFEDGRALALSPTGATTSTLAATDPISLTTTMIQSGVLPRGVSIVTENSLDELEVEDLLLVRGALGVYEFGWSDGIGSALIPGMIEVELILVDQVGFIQGAGEAATAAPPTPSLTPTVPITTTTQP